MRRLIAATLALALIPAAAQARHHGHRSAVHHRALRHHAHVASAPAAECDAWVQACDGPGTRSKLVIPRSGPKFTPSHHFAWSGDMMGFAVGGSLVARARAHMGETARQLGLRRTEWCSAFLIALTHARGVDDRAISWLHKRHVEPAVGSIAVMRHHVGVVSGFDAQGNPVIISGNHNRRVGEGVYPRRRIIAFVAPS